jgi:hypothetical protein
MGSHGRPGIVLLGRVQKVLFVVGERGSGGCVASGFYACLKRDGDSSAIARIVRRC